MCGIAGIVNRDSGGRIDVLRLQRMCDAIWHRGPDESGLVCQGPVGFGHRRLSIIDPANGRQPMTNADRTVWLTYNGEIYNFRALRSELEARGHTFSSQSDTEVLLRAYEAYGERCVEHLRGMFAFAIWDETRQTLLLARDRLGIKPLYYAVSDEEIAFASEIKGLLEADLAPPRLNQGMLPEFLATGFLSGHQTLFDGIYKLLPGHTLSWSARDGFCEHRYWQLPVDVEATQGSLEDHAAALRARLDEVVRMHLVSDVPVGVFLSGGLDSSGLAALMASMSKEPIRSFSVGFSEQGFSELEHARRVAHWIGSRHREVVVSPRDFFAALPSLVWHEDEPIAFPSSIPLNFVSRLAQKHVKVVLTGEGADELFLGYNRYRVVAWNERLGRTWDALVPGTVRTSIGRSIHSWPRGLRRYAERSFLARGGGIRDLLYENFAVFPRALQRELLVDPSVLVAADPHERALQLLAEAPAGTLERMSHVDLQTYLVELLMKQDQMSMAASIESRVPFLDHELVEQVARIPGHYKLHGLRTKRVLREALAGLVPPEILTRRKMGFPVPVGNWLRGRYAPLAESLLLGSRARGRGLFDPDVVARLFAEHHNRERNHADRLWLLMGLEIWQRIFVDGEQPQLVLDPDLRAA